MSDVDNFGVLGTLLEVRGVLDVLSRRVLPDESDLGADDRPTLIDGLSLDDLVGLLGVR